MGEQRLLTTATDSAPVEAPLPVIDIGDWLLHLPDAEYQRCAPGQHMAAGVTTTDDGRPMSINVEQLGGSLVIQHYVAEVLTPHRCVLVSMSDSLTPRGWTKVEVTWELVASADGDDRATYTNRVTVHSTDEFLAFLQEHGMTFEQAAAERGEAVGAHNRLETPLYAKSIERRSLAVTATP